MTSEEGAGTAGLAGFQHRELDARLFGRTGKGIRFLGEDRFCEGWT